MIERVDEVTVAAALTPRDDIESCTITMGASSHGIGVMGFSQTVSDKSNLDYWLGWSSLASPLTITTRPLTALENGVGTSAVPGSISVGPGALHVESAGISVNRIFHVDTATKMLTYAGTSPPVVGTERPRWTPTGAIALADEVPYTVKFLPNGGGNVLVVSPTPGYDATFVALDRARSNAITWLETQEGPSERKNLTIWTSPYAESSSQLQRRVVAKLPNPTTAARFTGFVTNAGMLLTVIETGRVRLVRLSDGLGWDIPPVEPTFGYTEALFVDDDFAYVGVTTFQPFVSFRQDGIVRIPRASLGPPTVATGL